MEQNGGVRIHVGGLGESVNRDDLLKIFSPMGSVEAVDFVRTKGRSFAYIDFSPSSDNSLTKLFSMYNGCVWKGGKLRLEKAKEHYLAKLRREWEKCSDDNTSCLPQPPPLTSDTSDDSHLKIFFPRLRKMKSVPLTGTGKHKYSFQRVQIPSLPKYFCDCEEHATSHTLQGNRCHDVESHHAGINEEELNIMNTVMNRLFQANGEWETGGFVENKKDSDIEEDDQDNLVINVVSSVNSILTLSTNRDLETVSRKRKSIHKETQETREGYIQGKKRNCGHPSKLKQYMPQIPENSGPSKMDADNSLVGSSRQVSDVNRSNSSVSRPQKSSWKALIASANNSSFSVSSVCSDSAISKEGHHTSSNSDFVNLPTEETLNLKEAGASEMEGSAAKSIVKKQKSKSKMPRKSASANRTERIESTPVVLANVESELAEVESSVRYSVIDTLFQDLSDKETIVGMDSNPVAFSRLTSIKDDQFVPEKSDAEKEMCKENQNLTVKENVANCLDEGKGNLEAFNITARGSFWRQKSSWTQLVSEKNSSFSITQIFPDLNSKDHEPREVNHEDDEEYDSTKRESATSQSKCKPNQDGFRAIAVTKDTSSDGVQPNQGSDETKKLLIGATRASSRIGEDGSRVVGIDEDSVIQKSPDALETVVAKEPGSIKSPLAGEEGGTCLFMRSGASLKAWADAKKKVLSVSGKGKPRDQR
ncbi:PREDICTED: uncharacterized protein LOC104803376 [Tarenaya hassleriana]|uniref:uncharacterized protein LOC104803376 n=1 Tax=Tarenaya hassleriana TaxID=28532 RepID=UPI00053C18F4|nr:PREDICTED: uncharacterized protein LOC104803376 [Tarenaya hassleriana]